MKWMSLLAIPLLFSSLVVFADEPEAYEVNPDLINVDGYVVLFNAQGPLSYLSATSGEVPSGATKMGNVHGESCQHALSLPVSADLRTRSAKIGGALGNGGYQQVFEKIKKEHPDITGIYDVRVDSHEVRILSVYSKLCTEITARGFTLNE
jgi:hypothetical protein